MRVSEQRLTEQGYRLQGYEYDYDAQRSERLLQREGFEVKLLREKTDTKGMKMYSVWIKEK